MTKAKELKESLNAAIDKLIDAIESEQVTEEQASREVHTVFAS